MTKWLQNYAYHTTLAIRIFFVTAVLAVAIVLLTVSYQAVKAASKNPVDTLRYE